MSRSSAWDRLLRDRREASADFFADVDDDPAEDLDKTLDSAVLEGAQRMDPGAGQSPWLDVHVSGPGVGVGALSVRIVDELLPPIQGEVDAALPDTARHLTGLELVGIGAGSAVLHLQPTVATLDADEEHPLPMVSSAIDSAIRRVFDMHDAVERGSPAAEIVSLGQPDMINRLHRLVNVLEENDLTLRMLWRSPTAPRRMSVLTRRGRTYAGTLFETDQEERQTVVAGYVFEQSLKGTLKLKRDPKVKTSAAYEIDIPRETLEAADLRLGMYVRVLVIERRRRDRLGQRTDPTYEFVRVVAHEEELG